MTVEKGARDRAQSIVGLATVAVVAYSAFLPLVNLFRLAVYPGDPAAPAPLLVAALATAVYLPLQLWLVLAVVRDRHRRAQRWAAAGVAVVVFAMIPVLGTDWLAAVYSVVVAVLLVVRRPLSVVALGALTAFVVVVAAAAGQPDLAVYFGVGTVLVAATVTVPIWLLRTARSLTATHAALTDAAVMRERARIADDLRPTVDAALDGIVTTSGHAADLVHHNVSVADRLLRDMVTQSRRTLSDVRRIITRYQDVSLQAEIETAATLLQASGIPTVVEMPEIDLPVADPAVRARLRDEVARLLRDPPSGGRVIAVGVRAGRVSVAVRPRDVTVGAGADQ